MMKSVVLVLMALALGQQVLALHPGEWLHDVLTGQKESSEESQEQVQETTTGGVQQEMTTAAAATAGDVQETTTGAQEDMTTTTLLPEVVEPEMNPDGECPDEDDLLPTYLADTKNCSVFYQCAHGVPYRLLCRYPLEFNPVLSVCDYPFASGCLYKNVVA